MWIRKDLKRKAKINIKENYWHAVIVSLLILLFAGGYVNTLSPINILSNANKKEVSHLPSNYSVTGDELMNVIKSPDSSTLFKPTDNPLWSVMREVRPDQGILADVYNSITDSNSVIFGIINIVNKSILGGTGSYILISIAGLLSMAIIQIYLRNILVVGEKRFYIENRVYTDSQIESVIFPYIVKGGSKAGLTVFIKSLYQFFWSLTIVGAFIKPYSYKMVPYILAENPSMKTNDAITLSRNMMNGHKFQTFLLDLSFLPWTFLNILTLGFLSIFYLNAYKTATFSELYMKLREEYMDSDNDDSRFFIDSYISTMSTEAHYDITNYPCEVRRFKRINTEGYDRSYSLLNLIMMFFIFSFAGWIWEVLLGLFTTGQLVNRGTMHGPWLPIYGTGGVLMLILLKRYSKSMGKTFFLCMLLSGILEYGTATVLWMTTKMKWWDYTGYFMNIKGRICLEGLLVFAIAGIAVIYFIAPVLDDNLSRINKKKLYWFSCVLVILFAGDALYSVVTPNTGEGVTSLLPPLDSQGKK